MKNMASLKIIRKTVWQKYIGNDKAKDKCLCCNVSDIDIWDFEAGHVVSKSLGGQPTIENLRPICSICNKSMGVQNMEEFMTKHKFVKRSNWDGIDKVATVDDLINISDLTIDSQPTMDKQTEMKMCKNNCGKPANGNYNFCSKECGRIYYDTLNPKKCKMCENSAKPGFSSCSPECGVKYRKEMMDKGNTKDDKITERNDNINNKITEENLNEEDDQKKNFNVSLKNILQQYCQKNNISLPQYESIIIGGDSHTPIWQSSVKIVDKVFKGKPFTNKLDAEINAVEEALKNIDVNKPYTKPQKLEDNPVNEYKSALHDITEDIFWRFHVAMCQAGTTCMNVLMISMRSGLDISIVSQIMNNLPAYKQKYKYLVDEFQSNVVRNEQPLPANINISISQKNNEDEISKRIAKGKSVKGRSIDSDNSSSDDEDVIKQWEQISKAKGKLAKSKKESEESESESESDSESEEEKPMKSAKGKAAKGKAAKCKVAKGKSRKRKVDYSNLLVAELKQILTKRKLSTSGLKGDLIKRLEEDDR
jgi:SAP domain/Double-stranded RNA binding motif/HNH endonuclease